MGGIIKQIYASLVVVALAVLFACQHEDANEIGDCWQYASQHYKRYRANQPSGDFSDSLYLECLFDLFSEQYQNNNINLTGLAVLSHQVKSDKRKLNPDTYHDTIQFIDSEILELLDLQNWDLFSASLDNAELDTSRYRPNIRFLGIWLADRILTTEGAYSFHIPWIDGKTYPDDSKNDRSSRKLKIRTSLASSTELKMSRPISFGIAFNSATKSQNILDGQAATQEYQAVRDTFKYVGNTASYLLEVLNEELTRMRGCGVSDYDSISVDNVWEFLGDESWTIKRSVAEVSEGIPLAYHFRMAWLDSNKHEQGDYVLILWLENQQYVRTINMIPSSLFENRIKHGYGISTLDPPGIFNGPDPAYYFNLSAAPYPLLDSGKQKIDQEQLLLFLDLITAYNLSPNKDTWRSKYLKFKEADTLSYYFNSLGRVYKNSWTHFLRNSGIRLAGGRHVKPPYTDLDTLRASYYGTALMTHVFEWDNWKIDSMSVAVRATQIDFSIFGTWISVAYLQKNRPYTLKLKIPRDELEQPGIQLTARAKPTRIEQINSAVTSDSMFRELESQSIFDKSGPSYVNWFAPLFIEQGLDIADYRDKPVEEIKEELTHIIFSPHFIPIVSAVEIENDLQRTYYFRGHFFNGEDIIIEIKPPQIDPFPIVKAYYISYLQKDRNHQSLEKMISLGLIKEAL
ncbi:MAG: hypothetical protein K9N29_00170 [Candidatus Marinimicrobia bacterium]|nr:hypothetical protein [Candidatus Neomarinimicrobiota bacterium]